MSVEAIIARARSLKAKFGVEKCENEEEKEDLQRWLIFFFLTSHPPVLFYFSSDAPFLYFQNLGQMEVVMIQKY